MTIGNDFMKGIPEFGINCIIASASSMQYLKEYDESEGLFKIDSKWAENIKYCK